MRVVGVVRAFEQTLVAPLSARTCVAYRSRVSANLARYSSGTARTSVQSPKAETLLIAPFLLDRGAEGLVIVDGEHARFDVKAIKLTAADAERKLSFLARHGYSSQGQSSGSFAEVVIEPGMTIAVSGVMMRDVALAPATSEIAFREGPPPTIRLTGNHEHPLVIGESKVVLALT
ncbi:MAG: hypothetical protein JWP01_3083 [Myxococcales bacterium]|nr:hypothetical protein [Myxococcales bacterium]